MNFQKLPFSILNIEKREIIHMKKFDKKRLKDASESPKYPEDRNMRDTVKTQDILLLDTIPIYCSFFN